MPRKTERQARRAITKALALLDPPAARRVVQHTVEQYMPNKITLPPNYVGVTFAVFTARFMQAQPRIAIELAKLADARSTDTEIGPGVEVIQRFERDGILQFAIAPTGEPSVFLAAKDQFATDMDLRAADAIVGWFDRYGEFDASKGEVVSVDHDKTFDAWMARSGKQLAQLAAEIKMSRTHVLTTLQRMHAAGKIWFRDDADGAKLHFNIATNELPRNERAIIEAAARLFGVSDVHGNLGLITSTAHHPHTLWMTALEKQFAAMRDLEQLIHLSHNDKLKSAVPSEVVKGWWLNAKQLRHADAYAWGSESTLAVRAASRSFSHDLPLHADQVPKPGQGWFYFDTPLPIATHDESHEVIALLWGWCYQGDGSGPAKLSMEPAADSYLAFTAFTGPLPNSGTTALVASTMWRWYPGDSVKTMLVRTADEYRELYATGSPALRHLQKNGKTDFGLDRTLKAVRELATFFLAASVWLDQDVLAWSPGHVERHRAKQIEREYKVPRPTDVKVIALRRVHYEKSEATGTASGREYSCQWIVDGHPRNQYLPSTGGHRVIWIEPYRKGPRDKPLRVPSHKVYAVVR